MIHVYIYPDILRGDEVVFGNRHRRCVLGLDSQPLEPLAHETWPAAAFSCYELFLAMSRAESAPAAGGIERVRRTRPRAAAPDPLARKLRKGLGLDGSGLKRLIDPMKTSSNVRKTVLPTCRISSPTPKTMVAMIKKTVKTSTSFSQSGRLT